MNLIHQWAIYLHVLGGIAALLLFWIPVFARKGSPIHKRIGRYFALLMYMIGISGLLMSSMDLLLPAILHPDQHADSVRDTAIFLFSLSLLVLASTHHGWLSVNHKDNRLPLRQPLQLILVSCLLLSGIGLLALGLTRGNTIFVACGGLEVALSVGLLRYTFKKHTRPRKWWTEHLGGLFASGIVTRYYRRKFSPKPATRTS
jgi:amino acid permease